MVNRRTDEEIAIQAHEGSREAETMLLEAYGPLVRRTARAYFLMGGEMCDLEQEGYIGLLKAIRSFSSEKKIAFRAFAKMCITRQMISAVKAANRKKHQPLNSYISLSGTGEEGDGQTMEETVADMKVMSPEENFLQEESYRSVEKRANEHLSPLEREVLYQHLSGKSYDEIAESLGKDTKAVDNALQRIRKKLKNIQSL